MPTEEYYHSSRSRVMNRFDEDFLLKDTEKVPAVVDEFLTFGNTGYVLESTVLYIDIRKSTMLADQHRRPTAGKLYSAFVQEMIRAARYYGGHVRGIVGDRVMVVYDRVWSGNHKDCFTNAVHTAYLMNSVMSFVLRPYFERRYQNPIQCGIGIDYGKMLVTKVGNPTTREDHGNYKDLVWLGHTANVASKLTDQANKDGYGPLLISATVHDEYVRLNPTSARDVTDQLWSPVLVGVGGQSMLCYTADIIWTAMMNEHNRG